jgi:uncharacterized membrane-anchored protein YitT (DUF2179 family)
MIRIISQNDNSLLEDLLRKLNLGVTTIDANGKDGMVKIVISILNRKDLPLIIREIKDFDPDLFFTIEDVHTVNKGFFSNNPSSKSHLLEIKKIFPKEKKR